MNQPTGVETPNRAPPNPPWSPLRASSPPRGCLSKYLSDDLSSLPVRAVTLSNNNKADPNLETKSYGVFSTCEKQMRSSVVKKGINYIFFVTRFGGEKVLAGYYHVQWFCYGTDPTTRYPDYVLSADQVRFVESIRLPELAPRLGEVVGSRFRPWRHLDPELTQLALEAIDAKPDITADYVEEIRRLERWNRFNRGFAYWGSQYEGFDWESAGGLIYPCPRGQVISLRNESPSGSWRCPECRKVSSNLARLRVCPECKSSVALISASPSD